MGLSMGGTLLHIWLKNTKDPYCPLRCLRQLCTCEVFGPNGPSHRSIFSDRVLKTLDDTQKRHDLAVHVSYNMLYSPGREELNDLGRFRKKTFLVMCLALIFVP